MAYFTDILKWVRRPSHYFTPVAFFYLYSQNGNYLTHALLSLGATIILTKKVDFHIFNMRSRRGTIKQKLKTELGAISNTSNMSTIEKCLLVPAALAFPILYFYSLWVLWGLVSVDNIAAVLFFIQIAFFLHQATTAIFSAEWKNIFFNQLRNLKRILRT